MKIFLEEEELIEIDPLENLPKNDNAIIITPNVRGRDKSELEKEIIAIDALELGPAEAARLHGIDRSNASHYSYGDNIKDKDARARILSKRHEIEDIAVTKLMDTLKLLDPEMIAKEKDKITVANGLSQIIDRAQGKDKNNGDGVVVHIHLPTQKKESDYKVIDV